MPACFPLSIVTALALTIGLLSVGPAEAVTWRYNFSYEQVFGSVISGEIVGTLQADDDTVLVSEIRNPLFDGLPAPALPVIDSVTNVFDNPTQPVPATVSLSGAVMDLFVCTDNACSSGFFLDDFSGVHFAGGAYGNVLEAYDPARWSLTPVPLPAALPMLAAGIAALGLMRRRVR
jgi:hypothetical protein